VVTLLIPTPADVTPHLVQAVARAGLDREDGPDLVAGELDEEALASVSAVFSQSEAAGAAAGAPRYDAASLADLAKVA
jgi:hypothetical protein